MKKLIFILFLFLSGFLFSQEKRVPYNTRNCDTLSLIQKNLNASGLTRIILIVENDTIKMTKYANGIYEIDNINNNFEFIADTLKIDGKLSINDTPEKLSPDSILGKDGSNVIAVGTSDMGEIIFEKLTTDTFNAVSEIQFNGTNITTSGTLPNFPYLDKYNVYSTTQKYIVNHPDFFLNFVIRNSSTIALASIRQSFIVRDAGANSLEGNLNYRKTINTSGSATTEWNINNFEAGVSNTFLRANGDSIFLDSTVTISGNLIVEKQLIIDNVVVVCECQSLVDDGFVNLPDAKTIKGEIWIDGSSQIGDLFIQSDGSVLLQCNSIDVVNTDTDGNLCIYDGGGTQAIIKNRLGSTKTVCWSIKYKQ